MKQATGDCYMVVLDVAEFVEAHGLKDVRIVHGIAVGRSGDIEGVKFGHAWVEGLRDFDAVAIDMSNGLPFRLIDRGTYYLIGRIDPLDCIKYTIDQCRQMQMDTGNFGPWTMKHMEVA